MFIKSNLEYFATKSLIDYFNREELGNGNGNSKYIGGKYPDHGFLEKRNHKDLKKNGEESIVLKKKEKEGIFNST